MVSGEAAVASTPAHWDRLHLRTVILMVSCPYWAATQFFLWPLLLLKKRRFSSFVDRGLF
jgi:hypothetical protein